MLQVKKAPAGVWSRFVAFARKHEYVVALVALLCLGVSARLTLMSFLHADTTLSWHSLIGAVFCSIGLLFTVAWSTNLEQDNNGVSSARAASRVVVGVLTACLAILGTLTYSWFVLNGVGVA